MVVRIRLRNGPKLSRKQRKNQHVALALAVLLTPAAITALALGFWRLAAEMRLAGQFAIKDGLFSHWQVWIALSALIQFLAILLNRYGNGQSLIRNSEEKDVDTILDSGF